MRIRPTTVRVATCCLLALICTTASSTEQPIPQNDGWVTDLGDFLTPQQETMLEALMESYKAGSGHEIALLTVPDLGGRALERYALEVARAWGLGEKGRNNSALLFVTRAERKIRIEVGRGLEGNLTDSISGRIIRDIIAPEFKRGRLYEGLRDGIQAMHAAAGGDYAKIPRRRGRGPGGLGLVPMIFFIWLISSLFRRGGRAGRGGLLTWLFLGSMMSRRSHGRHSTGWHGGSVGGAFGGFGGGGGFSGGGASGGW